MGGNFIVYKSSAGSGKTFTLVKEYLKHCLKSKDLFGFSRILAITFTNKATYEMKGRILTALKHLSNKDKEAEHLMLALVKETELSPVEIQLKCQQILSVILHNYADFSISTIDRFTHRLIRTFAKDLKLSPVFKVELDEDALLREVIDNLIDSIGRDKELTALILKFTFFRIDEERTWKVDKELLDFSKRILQERAMPFLKELRELKPDDYDRLIRSYSSFIETFENEINEIAREANELIKSRNIDKTSFAGNSKISVYFENLSHKYFDKLIPSNQLKNNVDQDKWHSGKCDPSQKLAIDEIKGKLGEAFFKIQDSIAKTLPKYKAVKEILKPLHSLSLLNEIEKKLSAYKKEEKVLNISDFNRIISEVVMNEPMPFIYERLGNRYQHIMIDEFQDTSVLQFMNLLPLMEDSLAKGQENLIVGDAKQAIYRFRGGEVAQFAEMPDYSPEMQDDFGLYRQRMQSLKSQYHLEELTFNYRSSAVIVEFNNRFFDFVKRLPTISKKIETIFHGHEQQLPSKRTDGYVEISFSEGKNKQEKQEAFQQKTLNSINQCINDGFGMKDIAILFRKGEHAENMASFLKENGLEVISSEALKLKNDATVNFIINLAKWIYQPEIHLTQKEIIEYLCNSSLVNYSIDEALNKFTSNLSLTDLLEEAGIRIDVNSIKLRSTHEFFESLIRSVRGNKEYNLYVQALQDVILDYSITHKSTISQLLEWWEDCKDSFSLDIPDDLEAVTLMTIHKSKGLEFPVVIYPYADQQIEHSGALKKDFLWTETLEVPDTNVPYALVEFNKNLSDSQLSSVYYEELERKQIDLINLVYVAFTRAVDRLYIHTERASNREELSLPQLLNTFVKSEGIEEVNGHFIIGEVDKKKPTKEKNCKESTIELEYLSNPWQERLIISQSIKNKWQEGEAIQYGLLLHEILGELTHKEKLEEIIDNYTQAGFIREEEKAGILQKLKRLIYREDLEPYFRKGIVTKREADLLSSSGKLLRPDRVVYLEDKLVVLDYKTGEKHTKHKKQVEEYVKTLHSTTSLPIEGFILYTETEELAEV